MAMKLTPTNVTFDSRTLPGEYHWTMDAYRRAGEAGVFNHRAQLELVEGNVLVRHAAGVDNFYWTAPSFLQAIDAGVFENPERLELLQGRIIDRMAQGPLHLSRRTRIARRLRLALEPRYYVIDECSLQIAFDGVPVADVVVLRGGDGDYDERLPIPDDAVLIAEVAVSSVEYDLGDKSLLYARAGVLDYWVALVEENVIVVHREPSPEGYRSVTRANEAATISPLAAPEVTLTVRDLLGPSG